MATKEIFRDPSISPRRGRFDAIQGLEGSYRTLRDGPGPCRGAIQQHTHPRSLWTICEKYSPRASELGQPLEPSGPRAREDRTPEDRASRIANTTDPVGVSHRAPALARSRASPAPPKAASRDLSRHRCLGSPFTLLLKNSRHRARAALLPREGAGHEFFRPALTASMRLFGNPSTRG